MGEEEEEDKEEDVYFETDDRFSHSLSSLSRFCCSALRLLSLVLFFFPAKKKEYSKIVSLLST